MADGLRDRQCATSNAITTRATGRIRTTAYLNVVQHGSYSNYHGMVVALQKQTGRASFLVNYTWSKVLGIRDGQTDNGAGDGTMVNPFNLRANYGPLAYDHTHIFNAAYVIHLPGAPVEQWSGEGRSPAAGISLATRRCRAARRFSRTRAAI